MRWVPARVRYAALCALALLSLSPLFSLALLRVAPSLPLDLGPADAGYAFGLSETWSSGPEGRFRELGRRSRLLLPVSVRGPGTLSLRTRGGAGRLRVRFDDGTVEEKRLPALDRPLRVTFEIPPERLRAHVRLRFEPDPGGGAAELSGASWDSGDPRPAPELVFAAALVLVCPFFAALLAGGSLRTGLAWGLSTGAILLIGTAFDPFAAIHLTLRAAPVAAIGAVLVALATRFGPRLAPSFRMLVYFAILARSAMIFHPSFYFSDLEMHETLVELAYHRGFGDLFARWPEYAGGMGLGASPLGEGRAAFPFPILFHGITHLGNSLWHSPVWWLKLNGSLLSALPLLPLGYLARRLSGARPGAELFAGSLYLLVPCFHQNLLLLKFSAATGHFFDLAVVAYLAHLSLAVDGLSRWIGAALVIAASLAAYNSGFIHIGLLVGGALVLASFLPGMSRRARLGLATAALAAVPVGLVGYQPEWVREFASSRIAEAADPETREPSPAEAIDPAGRKTAASLGWPVLILGIAGAAREVAKLPSAQRLLASSWLFSVFAAHGLRYVFPVLLLQQKEAYWAAAAFSLLGGLLLARLWRSGSGWGKALAVLALAAAAAESLRWFSYLKPYFFSTYLFR